MTGTFLRALVNNAAMGVNNLLARVIFLHHWHKTPLISFGMTGVICTCTFHPCPEISVSGEPARSQCCEDVGAAQCAEAFPDVGPLDVPADRRFELQKSRQLFISADNETLSVPAMRVNNPDCSPDKTDRLLCISDDLCALTERFAAP